MTRYQPTASKRTPTILQLLIVTMTATVIAAITACSGEQHQPNAQPQTTDERPTQTIEAMGQEIVVLQTTDERPVQTIEAMGQEIVVLQTTDERPVQTIEAMAREIAVLQTTDERPEQTIEAMAREIAVLQTKAAVPTEPDELGHTVKPALTITPATPQPTPSPARMIIPTPSGPGICGRSPVVQQAIQRTLSISSCRLVSNEELYRITYNNIQFKTLRSGDLAGIVNLKQLSITGNEPLPAGAFAGASIEKLNINEAHLSPGAFQDMISIKSLNIVFSESEQIPTLTDPVFDKLQQLHLDFYNSGSGPEVSVPPSGSELSTLKALKHFSIHAQTKPDSEQLEATHWRDTKPPFVIPTSLFDENTKLETIDLDYRPRQHEGVSFQLVVPHTLVEHLRNLKKITIGRSLEILERPLLGPPLALSPTSPLGKHLSPPDPFPEDWHDSSSLYYDLKAWYDWGLEGSSASKAQLQAQVQKEN